MVIDIAGEAEEIVRRIVADNGAHFLLRKTPLGEKENTTPPMGKHPSDPY